MPRRLSAFTLVLLAALSSSAATRITYDVNGSPTPLTWAPTAFPLRYEIDQRVAALNASAKAMVDQAFAVWAAVPGTEVSFESKGLVSNAAARGDDRIVVTVADELLRGQGAIALTTYSWEPTTGRMLDADISIDPSLFDGRVNASLALEHEVGHLLGLDHSAVISSVMYPWVGAGSAPANLDSDDIIAIASAYPKSDPTMRGATLTGRVYGDGGGIYAAQVVAISDRGQPVGTVLTGPGGDFTLTGLPAGRYRLYAEPLDGPVSVDVLQGSWRQAKANAFPTEFFGPPLAVESGKVYGNLVLSTAGAVGLNPRSVGISPPDANEIQLSTTPVFAHPGDRVKVTVGGDGFVSGMTEFEVLNPSFRRVSDFEWWDGSVSATFTVDPAAVPESAVIEVRNGRDTAMLTGALRVLQSQGRSRAVRK
jgi:hypothetical protein